MSKCKSHLELADDHGDNHCTVRCDLDENHEASEHLESFEHVDVSTGNAVNVRIIWSDKLNG